MRKYQKLLLLLFIAILSIIFGTSQSYAQALGMTINPSIIRLTAKPGKSIKTIISITNTTNATLTVVPQFRPFEKSASQDERLSFLTQSQARWNEYQNLFKTMSLTINKKEIEYIVIPPKQVREITLSISLANHQKISDYYFSVIFTTVSGSLPNQGNYANVSIGLGTHILLSVMSETKDKEKLVITEFDFPMILSTGPVPFSIKAKNISKHLKYIQPSLSIKNMFGQTIAKLSTKPTIILSGSTYQSNKKDLIWTDPVILGIYTATVGVLDDTGTLVTKSGQFLAIPYTIIPLTILTLLLLSVITYRVRINAKKL